MTARQYLNWPVIEESVKQSQTLCKELNWDFFSIHVTVHGSSSPLCYCSNYWIPLASLINYAPSTRKEQWWVWLFQALLRTSDEWQFIRSPQTRAQFVLQDASWLCFHFDFSGVTHMYIAGEDSLLTSQVASHHLICLFKTGFQVITFLKEDHLSKACKWSAEATKMQDDVVTYCSHKPFVLMK